MMDDGRLMMVFLQDSSIFHHQSSIINMSQIDQTLQPYPFPYSSISGFFIMFALNFLAQKG
jgi:hypothetical protein